MPNIENLLDGVAETLTDPITKHMEQLFSSIDLKYAYSQFRLHPDTAKNCNFIMVRVLFVS